MNYFPKKLLANKFSKTAMKITAAVALKAKESGQPRRFELEAYNGGPMNFPWAEYPVIVDLAGMQITEKPRPILKDHDPKEVVGHSDKIEVVAGSSLHVIGTVSGAGEAAREVVESSDNQFPWQASIGCDILEEPEFIQAGQDVTVNQQTFTGPLYVCHSTSLSEVSFVALGADDTTAARMVANKNKKPQSLKGQKMNFDEWLKNQGIDPESLTEEARAELQKAFDAKQKSEEAAAKAKDDAEKAEAMSDDDKAKAAEDTEDAVQAHRKAIALEAKRTQAIRKICAKHPDIEVQAIEDGWTSEKAELEVLRASRPQAPNINTGGGINVNGSILEVAALQAGRANENDLLKKYGEKTLEAADKRFRGRLSLQEMLLEAARANGYTGISFRQDMRGVLEAAYGVGLQAAFSSVEISGILSNIANKFLLDGFNGVEDTWRKIAAIGQTNDLKTMTSYALGGDMEYKKVGPDGEIESGTLGETTYTNKADTYARLLSITRTDMINDDLGAITKVPMRLGRGAALKFNKVFWTAFGDNSSFYTGARGNYIDGAGTTAGTGSVLSINALDRTLQLFREQTDPDGNPVGVSPATLLVPPALETTALALMNSLEVRDTTASKKTPTANAHAGTMEVAVSSYLSNSGITGYSNTAWYQLANPADLAVIEAVFLNGNESPTIETADADFANLGIQMRGYHDFGVAKQEYRAGVKSKGAAA